MTREEAIEILQDTPIDIRSTREDDIHTLYATAQNMAIEALHKTEWIPCSEKLPKENEYVGNVCKYYLIQDENGDMHVAHLSGRGWETIESIKALGCDVLAWMPLPEPYKGGDSE